MDSQAVLDTIATLADETLTSPPSLSVDSPKMSSRSGRSEDYNAETARSESALSQNTLYTSPWGKIITLIVGPDMIKIKAHSHILKTMPFFDACLNTQMKEKASGIVYLPDDFSEDVEIILHNAYGSRYQRRLYQWGYPLGFNFRGLREELIDKTLIMVRLYATAKKFGRDFLCTEIIQELFQVYTRSILSFVVVNAVLDGLNPGDLSGQVCHGVGGLSDARRWVDWLSGKG